MRAQPAAAAVRGDHRIARKLEHVPEPGVVQVGHVDQHAALVHRVDHLASEPGEASARDDLAAVPGVRARAVGQGHGAHPDVVQGVDDVQAAVQGVAVLDREDRGDAPAFPGRGNVSCGKGNLDVVAVPVDLPLEPCQTVEGVEQMVFPCAGDVDGETGGIDASLAHRGDIELQRGDLGVDLLPQAADGPAPAAEPPGPLSRKSDVAAEDMADGGVVVRIEDKGSAVHLAGIDHRQSPFRAELPGR